MTTKTAMRKYILEVASLNEGYLMNDLNGIDLLMDAVHEYVNSRKRSKEELVELYEKAKQQRHQPEEDEVEV